MKIILKEDVKELGKKDSVVEVSDGYARNFLIPRGIGVQANNSNLNIMNTKNDAQKRKSDRELEAARALANKLKNIKVIIKTKAGENGKLFGSITSKDITDKLEKDFKIIVDKKKVILAEPLKTICEREVEIKLYPKVTAKIAVKIEQE